MNVTILGGGGYVGSQLVPKLLNFNYRVTVLDKFWYGDPQAVFPSCYKNDRLTCVKGDIRDPVALTRAIRSADAVIHLACISNDPSFDLDPNLGRSINYDCFQLILRTVRDLNVKRFVYASSSSVYGVKESQNVTEDMMCEPLTDYSKYKLMCEHDLRRADMGETEWTIIRPATVCGWAPRMRLDLVVNILTINALVKKKILVHGGKQLRPNINIKDMALAYMALLTAKKERIHGQTFNAGFENMTVLNIAKQVKKSLQDPKIDIEVVPSNDNRSYHINSDKITRVIGFKPMHTVQQAIDSITLSYGIGKLRNPLVNPVYYNIQTMKTGAIL